MRVIFLDIDGVLNTGQSAVFFHRKWKTRRWLRFKHKIANYLIHLMDFCIPDSIRYGSNNWARGLSLWVSERFTDNHSFCPIACSNLQYILDEAPSDTRIVVSSVWRMGMTVRQLRRLLRINGVDGSKIIGKTPCGKGRDAEGKVGNGRRGHQIQDWIFKWYEGQPIPWDVIQISKFVIIDDDADMEHLLPNLVQTDGMTGLTLTDAEKIIQTLGGRNAQG